MGQRAPHDPADYTPRSRSENEQAVLATEFSEKFADAMRDRMIVSRHKYGLVAEAYPDKADALGSILARIDRYARTGNADYLADIANFAMIEWMHPRHKLAHYAPTDHSGSTGRLTVDGRHTFKPNDDLDPPDVPRTVEFVPKPTPVVPPVERTDVQDTQVVESEKADPQPTPELQGIPDNPEPEGTAPETDPDPAPVPESKPKKARKPGKPAKAKDDPDPTDLDVDLDIEI